MTKDTKRSGLSLAFVGIAGICFFWATDPRFGLFGPGGDNPVDAVNQAWPGTIFGIVGSTLVLLVGIWLMSRRTA